MSVSVDPLRAQPDAPHGFSKAYPASIRNPDPSEYAVRGFLTPAEDDEVRVLVEERDFLIVHKPAGMHCLPASSLRHGESTDTSFSSSRSKGDAAIAIPAAAETLSEWLCHQYPELAEETIKPARTGGSAQTASGQSQARGFDSGLLSRLDHDTSGLILVARTQKSLQDLLELQSAGQIEKRYVFLGSLSEQGLPGSRPLRTDPGNPAVLLPWRDFGIAHTDATVQDRPPPGWPFVLSSRFRPYGPGRRVVAAIGEGIEPPRGWEVAPGVYSSTFLDCLEYVSSPRVRTWLCRVAIHRGFRHQIRAHAAWLGFPILGDILYGGQSDSRLRLHSYAIAFPRNAGSVFRFGDWS